MQRLKPHVIDTNASPVKYLLAVIAGGTTGWTPPPTLLLEAGASVPAGTAVGTLIFEKAV